MCNHISSNNLLIEMRSDIENNRATYFRIVYYKLDSWIWEMFFESVLDEYNTTLFIGLWLVVIIKRVTYKVHLIYVIENGMENICWCNCVWYSTKLSLLFIKTSIEQVDKPSQTNSYYFISNLWMDHLLYNHLFLLLLIYLVVDEVQKEISIF